MGTIALEADLRGGVNADEVRSVVGAALRREAELARARRDQYARACRAYEERYTMTSDTFMQQFESGELGDAADYFDWFAAKRGLDLWERKLRILTAVSV
jgi:hypothetical protein